MSRNDIYALLFILLLAAGTAIPLLLNNDVQNKQIVIANQTGEIYAISFTELAKTGRFTKTFDSAVGPITFEFSPEQGVRVTEAFCPDKICLHSNPINQAKQTIACLPGKIFATIKAASQQEQLDAIIR